MRFTHHFDTFFFSTFGPFFFIFFRFQNYCSQPALIMVKSILLKKKVKKKTKKKKLFYFFRCKTWYYEVGTPLSHVFFLRFSDRFFSWFSNFSIVARNQPKSAKSAKKRTEKTLQNRLKPHQKNQSECKLGVPGGTVTRFWVVLDTIEHACVVSGPFLHVQLLFGTAFLSPFDHL